MPDPIEIGGFADNNAEVQPMPGPLSIIKGAARLTPVRETINSYTLAAQIRRLDRAASLTDYAVLAARSGAERVSGVVGKVSMELSTSRRLRELSQEGRFTPAPESTDTVEFSTTVDVHGNIVKYGSRVPFPNDSGSSITYPGVLVENPWSPHVNQVSSRMAVFAEFNSWDNGWNMYAQRQLEFGDELRIIALPFDGLALHRLHHGVGMARDHFDSINS